MQLKIAQFLLLSLIFVAITFYSSSLVKAEIDTNYATCEYIAINRTPLSNGSTFQNKLKSGTTFTAKMKMKNTGGSTWTKTDQYRLGSANDNKFWGVQRVELPADETDPNAEVIFEAEFTVPDVTITENNPSSIYPFEWQMLRERKEQNGQVIDTGGRFGASCSVKLEIDISENPGTPQCPNVTITNVSPANRQTFEAKTHELFLSWEPINNTMYNIRVDDLDRSIDSSTAIGADGPNDCGQSEGYDICVNNWANNQIKINVQPGHSYRWWVDVVPTDTQCTSTTQSNRSVNTFSIMKDEVKLTARTICTDHGQNLQKVAVNWSGLSNAKSFQVFIQNDINPDGSRRKVYDYRDNSTCLPQGTTSYTTETSLPGSANFRASVIPFSDDNCTLALPSASNNPAYTILPINGGFLSPQGQKNPDTNQYYWQLQNVIINFNGQMKPLKLDTCAPTSMKLVPPTGKNQDTPFEIPAKVLIYKSQPTKAGSNNLIPGTPKTVIFRYTPVVSDGEGNTSRLRPVKTQPPFIPATDTTSEGGEQ